MAYPPTHRKKARELHAAGNSYQQIANELNVRSLSTVHAWVNSEEKVVVQLPDESSLSGSKTEGRKPKSETEAQATSQPQSKQKASEQLKEATLKVIAELESLSKEPPADENHPAIADPRAMADRLAVLSWDLTTALRAVIPFGDVKQISGALKVCVDAERLLRGKATMIIGGSIAVSGEEGQREQLGSRIDAISARLEDRARSARIQGVIPGGSGGEDRSSSGSVG